MSWTTTTVSGVTATAGAAVVVAASAAALVFTHDGGLAARPATAKNITAIETPAATMRPAAAAWRRRFGMTATCGDRFPRRLLMLVTVADVGGPGVATT